MKFLNLLLNEGKHIKYWINLQKGGGLLLPILSYVKKGHFFTNPFLCEVQCIMDEWLALLWKNTLYGILTLSNILFSNLQTICR